MSFRLRTVLPTQQSDSHKGVRRHSTVVTSVGRQLNNISFLQEAIAEVSNAAKGVWPCDCSQRMELQPRHLTILSQMPRNF